MAKRNANVLKVGVEFGGVSIGENTARLGVRISRERLNLVAADEVFTNHRLTGSVALGDHDDANGQTTMFEDQNHVIEATFDTKRLGVTATELATGLTFSLSDIDVAELAKFSKGRGVLTVSAVAALPDDEPEDDLDDDDEDDHEAGLFKTDEPWREFPLTKLNLSPSIVKALKAAKLNTMGQLADYSSKPNARLTDIKGLGPGKAALVEEATLKFWQDNPQAKENGDDE